MNKYNDFNSDTNQVAYTVPIDNNSQYDMNGHILQKNQVNYLTQASAPQLPPYTYRTPDYDKLFNMLVNKGFSRGLAQFFVEETKKFTKYYYLLDTSGSMSSNDGKQFIDGHITRCSRFAEMSALGTGIYELFSQCGIPAKFINFNGLSTDTSINYEQVPFNKIVETPSGGTPLKSILTGLYNEIAHIPGNKKLVLVTDGESTDGDITEIIKQIQHYNTSITIRLCTDQRVIVDYWNNIDKDLEIRLDIIDSYPDEIEEVNVYNKRLNYTKEFHSIREYGVLDHRLDHVDENALSPDDIKYFNSIIGPRNSKNYCNTDLGCIIL